MSTAWVWIRSVAIYGIIGFVYLGLSVIMIVLANLEKNNELYHCKLDQLPLVGFFSMKSSFENDQHQCVHNQMTNIFSQNSLFHSMSF